MTVVLHFGWVMVKMYFWILCGQFCSWPDYRLIKLLKRRNAPSLTFSRCVTHSYDQTKRQNSTSWKGKQAQFEEYVNGITTISYINKKGNRDSCLGWISEGSQEFWQDLYKLLGECCCHFPFKFDMRKFKWSWMKLRKRNKADWSRVVVVVGDTTQWL